MNNIDQISSSDRDSETEVGGVDLSSDVSIEDSSSPVTIQQQESVESADVNILDEELNFDFSSDAIVEGGSSPVTIQQHEAAEVANVNIQNDEPKVDFSSDVNQGSGLLLSILQQETVDGADEDTVQQQEAAEAANVNIQNDKPKIDFSSDVNQGSGLLLSILQQEAVDGVDEDTVSNVMEALNAKDDEDETLRDEELETEENGDAQEIMNAALAADMKPSEEAEAMPLVVDNPKVENNTPNSAIDGVAAAATGLGAGLVSGLSSAIMGGTSSIKESVIAAGKQLRDRKIAYDEEKYHSALLKFDESMLSVNEAANSLADGPLSTIKDNPSLIKQFSNDEVTESINTYKHTIADLEVAAKQAIKSSRKSGSEELMAKEIQSRMDELSDTVGEKLDGFVDEKGNALKEFLDRAMSRILSTIESVMNFLRGEGFKSERREPSVS